MSLKKLDKPWNFQKNMAIPMDETEYWNWNWMQSVWRDGLLEFMRKCSCDESIKR
jgi:hypothetical protein